MPKMDGLMTWLEVKGKMERTSDIWVVPPTAKVQARISESSPTWERQRSDLKPFLSFEPQRGRIQQLH